MFFFQNLEALLLSSIDQINFELTKVGFLMTYMLFVSDKRLLVE